MRLAAVIFDMDGVLVDSEPTYDRETAAYLRELGVEPDPDLFDTLRGLPLAEVWTTIARHHRLPHPVEELAAESVRRLNAYFEQVDRLAPVAGVRKLLRGLTTDGIRLAVASSSVASRVQIILDRLAIARHFDAVVSGDLVGRGKPDPEIFLTAARRLEVEPSSCVVVEDSARGVAAALAAGMRCVAYAPDPSHSAGLEGADLVVSDFRVITPERLRDLVARSRGGAPPAAPSLARKP